MTAAVAVWSGHCTTIARPREVSPELLENHYACLLDVRVLIYIHSCTVGFVMSSVQNTVVDFKFLCDLCFLLSASAF